MRQVAEKKNTIHQGKNVRFAREFKNLSQQNLADKLNKQQSEISKIENQETIDDELLEQIALALEISSDFLKKFDFEDTAKNYFNNTTVNSENSHDLVNNQGTIYYPVDELADFTEKFLNMQKEHYEKELTLVEKFHKKEVELEKENALLKQKIELLEKGKF